MAQYLDAYLSTELALEIVRSQVILEHNRLTMTLEKSLEACRVELW